MHRELQCYHANITLLLKLCENGSTHIVTLMWSCSVLIMKGCCSFCCTHFTIHHIFTLIYGSIKAYYARNTFVFNCRVLKYKLRLIQATNATWYINLFNVQALLTLRKLKSSGCSQHPAYTIPVLMCSLMNKHISGPVDRPSIFDVLSLALSFLVNIYTHFGPITVAPTPLGDCFTGPWQQGGRRGPLEEQREVWRLATSCLAHTLSCSCRPFHSRGFQVFLT